MNSIDSLTDEQAIQAVKLFHECSDARLWEDSEKPSPEFVKMIAEAVATQAPADLQPGLNALLDNSPEHTAARAEVCRFLLGQLRLQTAFQATVDRAVEMAAKPRMDMGIVCAAFIICAIWSVGQNADGLAKVIKALDPKGLLEKLPPVIKAFPAGIWEALSKAGKAG